MKRINLLATVCSVAVLAGSAQAQNLLVNGDLDLGTAPASGDPGTATGWTLTNVNNATAGQFQDGFADNTGVRGLWFRAFLGNATAAVDSILSQDIVAPLAGDYLLTFDAIIEQNFTADSISAALTGVSSVSRDLTLDRISAGSTYTGGGFANIGAADPPYNTQVSLLLPGVNAGDNLSVSVAMLQGIGGGANPQSAVFDNFSLVRIPEPTSLLLGGLGVVGLIGMRRRSA